MSARTVAEVVAELRALEASAHGPYTNRGAQIAERQTARRRAWVRALKELPALLDCVEAAAALSSRTGRVRVGYMLPAMSPEMAAEWVALREAFNKLVRP